jgi:hypothetical protein
VGVLLFPFYVRACSPTRASSKRNPTSELSLEWVLFSRVSIASPALSFFSFAPPVAEKVRVRVRELLLFVGCGVLMGKTRSFAINRGKKKQEKRLFVFFRISQISSKNIENIIYRYAPFFISTLLNASDGDEFRRKMPTSLISRGGEDKEEEEGARAHARAIGERSVVEEKKKRKKEEEEARETRSLPWLLVKRYPGYLGGGVEVSEHDGC